MTSFTRGVSLQPSHAPENSISGGMNWTERIVFVSANWSLGGMLMAVFQLRDSVSRTLSMGVMVSALTGQAVVQTVQPAQS